MQNRDAQNKQKGKIHSVSIQQMYGIDSKQKCHIHEDVPNKTINMISNQSLNICTNKAQKNEHQIRQNEYDKISTHKSMKSRLDLVSGISFSRFQQIEDSQIQSKQSNNDNQTKQQISKISREDSKGKGKPSQGSIKRVPISSKIISSNKIIQPPVQIKEFRLIQNPVNDKNRNQNNKKYCDFNYINIKGHQIFEKFAQYAKKKKMSLKISDGEVVVIKKCSIFKSALKLCFPSSSQLDHQVYKLTCPKDQFGLIQHISGSEQAFQQFRKDFLMYLWISKNLHCQKFQQYLQYFIKFVNQKPKNQQDCSQQNAQSKKQGQIDKIKNSIEKFVKKNYQIKAQNASKAKNQKRENKQNDNYTISKSVEFMLIRQQLQMMQQNAKALLERQLKKDKLLNTQRKQDMMMQKQNLNKNQVTPSIQRMLMTSFYLYLRLDTIVYKWVIGLVQIKQFQNKKVLIREKLRINQIFKYLQLQQYYKLCCLQSTQKQDQKIFPNSIKLLSNFKYQNYPCPAQAVQIATILKNNIKKQIKETLIKSNSQQAKIQDHSDEDKTFLQFCIYCVLMSQNQQLWTTVETAIIFSSQIQVSKGLSNGRQIYDQNSIKILHVLKKSIDFILNEWQI